MAAIAQRIINRVRHRWKHHSLALQRIGVVNFQRGEYRHDSIPTAAAMCRKSRHFRRLSWWRRGSAGGIWRSRRYRRHENVKRREAICRRMNCACDKSIRHGRRGTGISDKKCGVMGGIWRTSVNIISQAKHQASFKTEQSSSTAAVWKTNICIKKVHKTAFLTISAR